LWFFISCLCVAPRVPPASAGSLPVSPPAARSSLVRARSASLHSSHCADSPNAAVSSLVRTPAQRTTPSSAHHLRLLSAPLRSDAQPLQASRLPLSRLSAPPRYAHLSRCFGQVFTRFFRAVPRSPRMLRRGFSHVKENSMQFSRIAKTRLSAAQGRPQSHLRI
jgi:hypothetical protein